MVIPVAVLVVATFALLARGPGRDRCAQRGTAGGGASNRVRTRPRRHDRRGECDERLRVDGERVSFLEPYALSRERLPAHMRTLDELVIRPGCGHRTPDSCLEASVDPADHADLGADQRRHEPLAAHRADDDRQRESWTRSATSSLARKPRRRARWSTAQRTLDASHRRSFMIGIVGMPLGVLASLILIALFTEGWSPGSARPRRSRAGWTTACRSAHRADPTTNSANSSGCSYAAAPGSPSCRGSSGGWARRTR